jgi:alpha-glucosidase
MKKVIITGILLSFCINTFCQTTGIQFATYTRQFAKDVPATIKLIAQTGIQFFEGGSSYGMEPVAFKKLLDDNKLKVVSVGAEFDELQNKLDTVIARAKFYGANYVACFWIPHNKATGFTKADADKAIAVFNAAGKKLKAQGLELCYHPHGFEFVNNNGDMLFDYLMRSTNPQYLNFEMDVFWVRYAGQNPAALLKKYKGRYKLLHLKDRRIGTPNRLDGDGDRESNVVLGSGDADIAAVMKEAKAQHIKYAFIEDESTRSVEQVPQSIEYLQSIAADEKNSALIFSPNKKMAVNIFINALKKLVYTVTLNNETVLEASPLGLQLQDGSITGKNITALKALPPKTMQEKYSMVTGKTVNINYTATEQKFIATEGNKQFTVTFRVQNDGIAFRYEINGKGTVTVEKELTGFAVPLQSKLWVQPYDKPTQWGPAYENYFENGIAAGTASPGEEGWCLPLLAQANNHWLHIAEAAVDENYLSVHVQYDAKQKAYTIRNPEQTDGEGYGLNTASFSLPGATSWKCITVGDNLQSILSSNLVFNVNKPNAVKDISWIKPGIASWSWWYNTESSKIYDSLTAFIDYAAQMKWAYSLVDANWNLMGNDSIALLAKYASSKKIGLWMWYNSGGANNTVTEMPRNRLVNKEQRRKEFAWLHSLGIKGLKIDFFQSDKQIMMQQYMDILKDAADYKLMINFHGCTMPKGWSRTYPNLLSMEAVAGAESYMFKGGYDTLAPRMNTIYPFTRNVVGGMDYTPVTFSHKKFVHKTTYAHELALTIIFETGILHPADHVSYYLSVPVAVKEFLSTVPTVWSEVKYISGYPGRDLVLARRSGMKWYVAGINGEGVSKELPLHGFMSGKKGLFITDETGNNKQFSFGANLPLPESITVKPYGGFLIVLE